MATFEGKVKIGAVIHTLNWDANDKITIPLALEEAITSEELVRLLALFHGLRTWMNVPSKVEIRLVRSE